MKYKTDNFMVSFIDILGAKEKIINECDLSLNVVHEAYEKALKLYQEEYPDKQLSHNFFDDAEEIGIRIFSDNIVLYARIKDDETACFLQLVYLTAFIQGVFLGKGLFTRGGIAKGDFFADDVMLWGKALVNAYQIESHVSIYPRVVIHPTIINNLEKYILKNCECVVQDEDGYFYVNYLMRSLYYDFDSLTRKTKSLCGKELSNANYGKENEKMRLVQKIIWLKNYIGRCDENIEVNSGEENV